MYEGVVTNIWTCGGLTDEFSITIGLHQGSALSPFLFAIVMDEITKSTHEDIPWCMLFVDDIVQKTEYMECKFRKKKAVPLNI